MYRRAQPPPRIHTTIATCECILSESTRWLTVRARHSVGSAFRKEADRSRSAGRLTEAGSAGPGAKAVATVESTQKKVINEIAPKADEQRPLLKYVTRLEKRQSRRSY